MQHLFSPLGRFSPGNIQYTPLVSKTPTETCAIGLKDKICWLQIELVEEAWGNQVLLEHLFTSFRIVAGKKKTLKVELDHGLIPRSGVDRFKCNLDFSGWSLKQ
jgi:hypothetical protein